MKFTKMQGLGNDYVYVNCFQETVENPAELAVRISNRHFGVGSDGLILIKPSARADCEMEMYNADGSRAEMCGNGIRCVAKYAYDYGLIDKEELDVDTLAGVKHIRLEIADGKARQAEVDMGEPVLAPEAVPVKAEGPMAVDEPITVGGREYRMTCVSMGNPHAVVYVDDVDNLDLEAVGPLFENHERFPQKVNTEFVQVISPSEMRMRVWERGSGETLACGTGACAVAVAGVLNKAGNREVTVHLVGGDLRIRWDEESGHVFMKGPAETVFEGEIG